MDASATPRLGVSLAKVGNPPALLSVAGTASLSGALRPSSYSYDAVGNTLCQSGPSGTTTCTWDAESRLTSATTNGDAETYTYDASTSVPGKVTGLRRSKTSGAGTRHFVWDQQNVLAELDGSLARLAQYTDLPGMWGGLSARCGASSSSFYGFDLSANMRALFGSGGGISESALYSAFGPMLNGTLSQPYGFGGQVGYYGDAAERLYVRARHLAPELGRWWSRDPLDLRLMTGRHHVTPIARRRPYGYVSAAPSMATDPYGLIDWIGGGDTLLCIIAAVVGLAGVIFPALEPIATALLVASALLSLAHLLQALAKYAACLGNASERCAEGEVSCCDPDDCLPFGIEAARAFVSLALSIAGGMAAVGVAAKDSEKLLENFVRTFVMLERIGKEEWAAAVDFMLAAVSFGRAGATWLAPLGSCPCPGLLEDVERPWNPPWRWT